MPLYTLTSHTNANAVRGSTLKDVERFRNGSVHELLAKSKFKRDSYEISNEQYEQNDKTINLTNFEAETNPSDVEKSKNLDKQNFKGETDNNIEVAILDETKDSRRNWKCLITVILTLNILIHMFVFIVTNACKVPLDIAYIITIVVHGIVYVGSIKLLFFVWINFYTCSVEDMFNNSDECDTLEKVNDLSNVHQHNDDMSIKVQEFRSRYAKYAYYNCTRVVCECHDYKPGYKRDRRDREPSRVPVKMLKRLSRESRKLQNYVWSRVRRNTPKSSKLHRLSIRYTIKRKKKHKIGVRFVQNMRRKPTRVRKGCFLNKSGYKRYSSTNIHEKMGLNKYLKLFSYNFPVTEVP